MKKDIRLEDIPKQPIFIVPTNYFDSLPAKIKHKLLLRQNIFLADNQSFKQNIFCVPKGYFEQLDAQIQSKVKPESETYLSKTYLKTSAFDTPPHYFDSLSQNIKAKIVNECITGSHISIFRTNYMPILRIAAAILLLLVGTWLSYHYIYTTQTKLSQNIVTNRKITNYSIIPNKIASKPQIITLAKPTSKPQQALNMPSLVNHAKPKQVNAQSTPTNKAEDLVEQVEQVEVDFWIQNEAYNKAILLDELQALAQEDTLIQALWEEVNLTELHKIILEEDLSK